MKTTIFQRNFLSGDEKSSYDFVNTFDGADIILNTKQIKITTKAGSAHQYELSFTERDAFTETYLGKFSDGNKFRLIKPVGVALEMTKLKSSCNDAFTFGSVDPRGWAVHFYLY
jgi:hypothetical protein